MKTLSRRIDAGHHQLEVHYVLAHGVLVPVEVRCDQIIIDLRQWLYLNNEVPTPAERQDLELDG